MDGYAIVLGGDIIYFATDHHRFAREAERSLARGLDDAAQFRRVRAGLLLSA